MRREALTPREAEILVHVRAAESNKDIARTLGISEQAIKALVSRLLVKFDVENRAGLIAAQVDDRTSQLRRTEADLDESRRKLAGAREDLETSRDDLATAREDLATAREARDTSARDLQLLLASLQRGATAIVGREGDAVLRSAAYDELFPVGTTIADASGRHLPAEETPWARAQRGESFELEVVVGDRRIHVRGDGAAGGGGVIRAAPV